MSKFIKFIRPYTGFGMAYLSYRISVYILSELFNTIDEIIDTDTNPPNNTNELPDDTIDIITTHDYATGKAIVNAISTRGGHGQIAQIARRGGGIIRKQLNSIITFGQKFISTLVKPVANILGYLLLKIPALRSIYGTVKTAKTVIGSLIGLASIRLIARFDYWALIFSDAIPFITIDQKAVLAGIRCMRMKINSITICIPQSNEILNLLTDNEINLEKKGKALINFFSIYEFLPEDHPFKNPYFACIIHVLISLFIINKMGFRLALKLLLRLLTEGKISLKTYREIVSQLVIGGVSPVELEVI
jgi:hypothetical protein